jgi:integrase/recombinase XerD
LIPAFDRTTDLLPDQRRRLMNQAVRTWLRKTPSRHTRVNYARDLQQFLAFEGIGATGLHELARVHPEQVATWRDALRERGHTNATIRRKLTTLRSLFSYLQVYGYIGANPAHGKFVAAPAVPRDGKTLGLSPKDCRRLLEVPDASVPAGLRDRALLGVLAYSACRVGEVVALRVGDFRTSGEHRVLTIYGKGGKERTVPLHVEAVERLNRWIEVAGIAQDRNGALFRPVASPRGQGYDGFAARLLTARTVEKLVKKYVRRIGLDTAVTVHSLRVTALTTARERGAEILDLQDFAGHADPRTTLAYIRTRDRLSKSPAYVLHY